MTRERKRSITHERATPDHLERDLTPSEDGKDLEPAVLSLARWGNQHLGERNRQMVPTSTLVLSLRAMFNPKAAGDATATWEIHAADAVFHATIADGALTAEAGAAPTTPDLTLTITTKEDEVPTFGDIITAVQDQTATVTGSLALLSTFLQVFGPRVKAVGAHHHAQQK
jgi:hypothetical protein